jgi:hypothetical protein
MRIIEKKMAAAFGGGRNFYESNTRVQVDGDTVTVWLYSTPIADRNTKTGAVRYSCGGYWTTTTRSRLQALGAPARIQNYRMINTRTGDTFPDTLTAI